ncbi:CAP domain-containing protein [Paenibacillaceae bacterium WGS1546]|uniref:CAP domain-containing protein n=1 Tax=Cohnella sp. WGS1546 TaxID=3366810 RepID=UPI00372CE971
MTRFAGIIAGIFVAFAFAGIFGLPTQTAAAQREYADVPVRHWGYETVQWATENGIVQGDGKGNFLPNDNVSEPQFLAMLFRAYQDEIDIVPAGRSEPWYTIYYTAAAELNWPARPNAALFTRGHAADLLAHAAGHRVYGNESVRYLLEEGLARGKTANTVEGYGAGDSLTRVEAVTFIYRFKEKLPSLPPRSDDPPLSDGELRLLGIGTGWTEEELLGRLGSPERKDASEFGFTWYIYNADYTRFAQFGVANGKVVALYSNAADVWTSSDGIGEGITASRLAQLLGTTIAEADTYVERASDRTTTYYLDTLNGSTVDAIFVQSLPAPSGSVAASSALSEAYERQVFDLTNAFRAKNGIDPLQWDAKAALTARKHSKDMDERDYFSHTNPDGLTPFDRMTADGIVYSAAAENIANGFTNALAVHHGWLNSAGHRRNMLNDALQRLGVGAYDTYYTQKFYAPR